MKLYEKVIRFYIAETKSVINMKRQLMVYNRLHTNSTLTSVLSRHLAKAHHTIRNIKMKQIEPKIEKSTKRVT